jgi:hypothetical protein
MNKISGTQGIKKQDSTSNEDQRKPVDGKDSHYLDVVVDEKTGLPIPGKKMNGQGRLVRDQEKGKGIGD